MFTKVNSSTCLLGSCNPAFTVLDLCVPSVDLISLVKNVVLWKDSDSFNDSHTEVKSAKYVMQKFISEELP